MAAIRATAGDSTFVVAIGGLDTERGRRAISFTAGIADGVILADRDDIGVLLRALACDQTGTGAYAEAYSLLTTHGRKLNHGILADVLGSGCAVSTVKQLCAHRGCNRSTPLRICRRTGARTPNASIELAQAVGAILLIADGHMNTAAAAKHVGLDKPESLTKLVQRSLSRPLAWFRQQSVSAAPGDILAAVLSSLEHE